MTGVDIRRLVQLEVRLGGGQRRHTLKSIAARSAIDRAAYSARDISTCDTGKPEHVIKGPILQHQHEDMLDRARVAAPLTEPALQQASDSIPGNAHELGDPGPEQTDRLYQDHEGLTDEIGDPIPALADPVGNPVPRRHTQLATQYHASQNHPAMQFQDCTNGSRSSIETGSRCDPDRPTASTGCCPRPPSCYRPDNQRLARKRRSPTHCRSTHCTRCAPRPPIVDRSCGDSRALASQALLIRRMISSQERTNRRRAIARPSSLPSPPSATPSSSAAITRATSRSRGPR